MNKYLVKIDNTVLPDSYSLDELLANGLLDQRDENIQIKPIDGNEWVVARDYHFANSESPINNYVGNASYNIGNTYGNYSLNDDGSINRPGNYNRPRKPDTNLVWAIICISICLPFGILALIESIKVDSLYAEGDYDGAKKASDNSKQWSLWCLWAWLIIFAIIILAAIVK